MSGQPAGAFDVTGLTFTEVGGIAPPNIINEGAAFTVTVDFTGNPGHPVYGFVWGGMTGLALPYTITVFCESIGIGPEQTLTTLVGSLAPGVDSYSVPLTIPASAPPTLTKGLYQVAATVQVPAFPTWVGYIETKFIQVI